MEIVIHYHEGLNPFEQQISLLSTTENIFEIMNDNERYKEWERLQMKVL